MYSGAIDQIKSLLTLPSRRPSFGRSTSLGTENISVTRELFSELHCQHVVICAGTEAIYEDMIEWLHVRQFAQEGDHIRSRADITELAQQPRHWQDNPFISQVLFLEFVDFVIGMMNDRNGQRLADQP